MDYSHDYSTHVDMHVKWHNYYKCRFKLSQWSEVENVFREGG